MAQRAIPNEKRVWSTITTKTTDLKLLGDFVDQYAGIFVALWESKSPFSYSNNNKLLLGLKT